MRALLLNLISRIANRASSAVAQITKLMRSSAFWRSTYLIVLLSIWFWLASKFWMLLYFWKRSGEAGTLIVILGVVGELVADLWYEERKREQRTISGLSTLILILGLVIELYSNGRVSALSDDMIAGLESQVSHTLTAIGPAMERASDANATAESAKASVKGYDKQIAEANERAGKANQQAGEANKLAASIERENLQLRAEIEPRRLTKSQKSKLRDLLSSHPTPVAIASCALDNEAEDFADDLARALGEAHWDSQMGTLASCSYGVKIGATADTIGAPEVKLLSDALVAAGIPNELVTLKDARSSIGSIMTFTIQSHSLYLMIEKHPPLSRISAK